MLFLLPVCWRHLYPKTVFVYCVPTFCVSLNTAFQNGHPNCVDHWKIFFEIQDQKPINCYAQTCTCNVENTNSKWEPDNLNGVKSVILVKNSKSYNA